MGKSNIFHLQHYSSKYFVHPLNNDFWNGNFAVLHPDKSPPGKCYTQYYLEYQDGPFGYLTSFENPEYCIHPVGGSINPAANTTLCFHKDRHPGAYFAINELDKRIVHVSGLYLHPYMDYSIPTLSDPIVLAPEAKLENQFIASDGANKPVDVSDDSKDPHIDWRLVFAEDDPIAAVEHEYIVRKGLTTENSKTASVEVSAKLEYGHKLFGGSGKASLEVKTAYANTDSRTWSAEKTETAKYTVAPHVPVAVWQLIFRAKFDDGSTDGSTWEFGSGNIFKHTESSQVKPTYP